MNHTSDIKDNWSQITIANTVITEEIETFQELPKCDTETWTNAVGKMALEGLLDTELPQIFILFKKKVFSKDSKVKYSKTRCAFMWSFMSGFLVFKVHSYSMCQRFIPLNGWILSFMEIPHLFICLLMDTSLRYYE